MTIPAGTAAGTYTAYVTVSGAKYVSTSKNPNAYPRFFEVVLEAATNANVSGGTSISDVTISGVGASTPSVSIAAPATVHVPASGATTVKVPVTLSVAATSNIVLTYSTIGGTATSGNGDYSGVTNATYTIPAGSAAGTYYITISNVKHETAHGSYPKTFQVKLSSATNANVTGSQIVTVTLAFP